MTVALYRSHTPALENNIWLKKNPWFEQELLPELKEKIGNILK